MPATWSRRGLLGGLAAGVTAGGAQAAEPSLSAAARRGGRYFGAAVRIGQLKAEPDLLSAVLSECDRLTPEVELKWSAVEPRRGELTLGAMDELCDLALAHGKSVRGHTLLWRESLPLWAVDAIRTDRDWGVINRRFASLMPRYGRAIRDWDVVNEPIEAGGRSDGLRPDVFLDAFGPDYIARAFEEASLFAPHARLFLNEFGLEHDTADEEERRGHLLRLVERLKRRGTPIHGVGLQAHLSLAKPLLKPAALSKFAGELAGMGAALAVTELDVKEHSLTLSAPARDQLVADTARRYLDGVLSVRQVEGVTTWGLSDRHSWLSITAEDLGRYPGAWGPGEGPGLNRGLPLDAGMTRKPLYAAVVGAMAAKTL